MHALRLNGQVSIGGQPGGGDIQSLWRDGYRSIVNFRGQNETVDQTPPDDEGQEVKSQRMHYFHLPTTLETIRAEVIDRFRAAYQNLPKPIFAHCATGKRAAAMALALVACDQRMTSAEVAETARRIGLQDRRDLIAVVQNYVATHSPTG
jgi:uncharacterized protein (TIGR01244 family)